MIIVYLSITWVASIYCELNCDFVQLRDREMEIKAQITAITSGVKEGQDAEAQAAGESGGPQV